MQFIKYIIIFLPIILVLLVCILDLLSGDRDFKEYAAVISGVVILTIFYNLLLFCVFFRINSEDINQPDLKYNLVSTKFSNNIEGNFFLGTGNIKNEEYIYYTVKEGNEIKRNKTKDYKIFITDEDPCVVVESKTTITTVKNWLYNINSVTEELVEIKSTFYVPENSIVQNININ